MFKKSYSAPEVKTLSKNLLARIYCQEKRHFYHKIKTKNHPASNQVIFEESVWFKDSLVDIRAPNVYFSQLKSFDPIIVANKLADS